MKDLGIKLFYLYRDEQNFKDFGFEVFTNITRRNLSEIEANFKKKIIDSEFFYPDDFGIKRFHLNQFDNSNEWYEFEKFEEISLTEFDNKSFRDIQSIM